MFYVYVLYSQKDKGFYFGYTSDLRKRLDAHNQGKNTSTKNRRPLILVYYEAYLEKGDAIEREQKLKQRGQAVRFLKKRLNKSLAKLSARSRNVLKVT